MEFIFSPFPRFVDGDGVYTVWLYQSHGRFYIKYINQNVISELESYHQMWLRGINGASCTKNPSSRIYWASKHMSLCAYHFPGKNHNVWMNRLHSISYWKVLIYVRDRQRERKWENLLMNFKLGCFHHIFEKYLHINSNKRNGTERRDSIVFDFTLHIPSFN